MAMSPRKEPVPGATSSPTRLRTVSASATTARTGVRLPRSGVLYAEAGRKYRPWLRITNVPNIEWPHLGLVGTKARWDDDYDGGVMTYTPTCASLMLTSRRVVEMRAASTDNGTPYVPIILAFSITLELVCSYPNRSGRWFVNSFWDWGLDSQGQSFFTDMNCASDLLLTLDPWLRAGLDNPCHNAGLMLQQTAVRSTPIDAPSS